MIYWWTYIRGGPLSLYCVFANIIIYLFNNLTVPDQTANKMNEQIPFSEQKKKSSFKVLLFVKSVTPWHRHTAQLHSAKPEFCAGSNPARGMSEIREGEDL